VVQRVLVLAQDLIWADRLARAVDAAGAAATVIRDEAGLDTALQPAAGSPGPSTSTPTPALVIDLTARAYDAFAAIERAHAAGARILAVGQHDDVEQRKRALAAGADRVLAYRKLFEDGPRTIATWLAAAPADPGVPA
jgi:DNA-binding response OmpR family regulator